MSDYDVTTNCAATVAKGTQTSDTVSQPPKQVQYYENDFDWADVAELRKEQCVGELAPELADPEVVDSQIAKSGTVWEQFYQRHKNGFFKKRSYLVAEFPVLTRACNEATPEKPVRLIEAGCGTGSALLPLLNNLPNLVIAGADVSAQAVELLLQSPEFSGGAHRAWVCDLAQQSLVETGSACFPCYVQPSESNMESNRADVVRDSNRLATERDSVTIGCEESYTNTSGGVDCVKSRVEPPMTALACSFDFGMLIFTLSAFPVRQHRFVVRNLKHALRADGYVLFRDYGMYDMVQVRCKQRLEENFYMKADGVQCYFFSTEYLSSLFEAEGFETIEAKYCTVRNVNRKTGVELDRVFVHGLFRVVT